MIFRLLILLVLIAASMTLADSVRTLDGRVFEGQAKIDPAGGITIAVKTAGPTSQRVDFSQLLRARFDNTSSTVPIDSWLGLDVGAASEIGGHKVSRGQLQVSGSGNAIGGKADAFRFVYQPLHDNGEVSARVLAISGNKSAGVAGVMIRGSFGSDSPMAALVVSHDGKLRWITRTRTGDAGETRFETAGNAPIWLRIVRRSDLFIAFRSIDGREWTRLASADLKFDDNALAGMAMTAREPGLANQSFDRPRVAADEPVGVPLTPLEDLRRNVERNQNPGKGDGAPMLHIGDHLGVGVHPGGQAAVRYPLDRKYQALVADAFVVDWNNKGGTAVVQIFLDGEKAFDSGLISKDVSAPLNLPVSGKNEIRIVAIDGKSGKQYNQVGLRNARLQLQSSDAKPVVKSQFGSVVTVDGAVYSGTEVRELSPGGVVFSRGDRVDLKLPIDRVARITYPGFQPAHAGRITPGSTGVIMLSGDYYEGDIERFSGRKLQVNSVIFGPREFDVRTEVAAIVLREIDPAAAGTPYVVEATDGSLFAAETLAPETGGRLLVTDRHLGRITLDPRTLREIRYGGDRLKWISDLRLRRLDPAAGRSALESLTIDATPVGANLRFIGGVECERGLTLAAGSAVSYDLDGQYQTLLALLGVPDELLPGNVVVFVVESEGKELFRSPPRTSLHDPLPLAVDVAKAKAITLRVEPDKDAGPAALGLWGDAILVKTRK